MTRIISKNYFTTKKEQNRTLIIATIVISPVTYVLALICYLFYLFYEPQQRFDSNKWLTDKASRIEMKNNLVESKILEGKNKEQIIQLLGKPDGDAPDRSIYDLQSTSAGFGWEHNFIEVKYKNKKVFSVKAQTSKL